MPSSSNAFYLAICLFLRLAICLFLLMLWIWYFENESTELDSAGQVDETINFWVMSGLTSSFTCHLISDITTLIIHHSFTLSLLAQNLPFQQIIPTLDFFYPGLPSRIMGLDRTGLIILLDLFSVHFFFNFSVCPVWWTRLATRQLFIARYILNIVSWSYRRLNQKNWFICAN